MNLREAFRSAAGDVDAAILQHGEWLPFPVFCWYNRWVCGFLVEGEWPVKKQSRR